ncbi:MAG: arginine--tRNA ligase, partial [Vibrionaceae bacterium]
MNIQTLINDKISSAMQAAGAPNDCPALVRQSAKAQFGEYQANGIMAAAKKLGMAPRTFAEQVIEKLDLSGIATKVEIAGPGFINIFLDSDWLAATARAARQAPRLGITRPAPQTIVVDYSAPNVAKEMHVGHLRSTIIGDAVTRTLEFLGHNVIRANHLGDWGTQFGMLIANLERHEKAGTDISMDLQDIEGFYRESKQLYDEDPQFATTARQYVVKLQSGDAYCLQKWRTLVDITVQQNQQNYDRLNVSLTPKDIMSESMYNPMLAGLVVDLKA